jgi:hypothetical protein
MCNCTRKIELQQHRYHAGPVQISEIYVESKGVVETLTTSLEAGGNVAHAITCGRLLSKILDGLVIHC